MSRLQDRRPAAVSEPSRTRLLPVLIDVGLLLVGAAWGAAILMIGPPSFGDIAQGTGARVALPLAAAAFVLFLLHDPRTKPSRAWQLLWTISLLAFLFQLWSAEHMPRAISPDDTLRLAGIRFSDVLLSVLWAAGVGLAWARPEVIWPQGVLFLVLTGAALEAFFSAHTAGSWVIGALLTVAISVAATLRIKRVFDLAAAAQADVSNPVPQTPSITLALILKQVWQDANGKEVQCAATYSYLWLADQVGHVGLGMAVGFLATGVADLFSESIVQARIIGFGIAGLGVCLWEVRAYCNAVGVSNGPFPPGKALLLKNAVIAALYMVIGVLLGCAFLLTARYQVPMVVALTFVGVVSAKYWVRQKIIWQKAGLPYLFRLHEAKHTIMENVAEQLLALIEQAAPPTANPQQVVIAGPVGSGRTMLASGIGTEFAFCDKAVRYLSLDRMLEFASAPPPAFDDDTGPSNIGYWPWMGAQVLVIDDIGPLVDGTQQEHFSELLNHRLAAVREHIGRSHTVWILGDLGSGATAEAHLARSAKLISEFCRGKQDPMTILLKSGAQAPAVHVSQPIASG